LRKLEKRTSQREGKHDEKRKRSKRGEEFFPPAEAFWRREKSLKPWESCFETYNLGLSNSVLLSQYYLFININLPVSSISISIMNIRQLQQHCFVTAYTLAKKKKTVVQDSPYTYILD